MNLITNLRNWFLPWNNAHKSPTTGTTTADSAASTYEQLFADLQHVCTRLPGGEVFVVMGGGEFSVRMTWTPDDRAKNEQKRMFSLNGGNEIIEWVDAQPDEAAEARILTMEQPPVIEEDTVKDPAKEAVKDAPQEEVTAPAEESPAQPEKPSRQQQMMQRLTRYLKLHYAFRYNLLTERTECARINTDLTSDPHHLIYTPVDSRTLNGIALDAIDSGVDCWDRDVKRYVESDHVQAYHPFDLYFKHLPTWDGTDRVTELAKRVSDSDLWTRAFHRWMLAVTAQWTGRGGEGRRANSVAPLLVSTAQGFGKSMPPAASAPTARLLHRKLRPDQRHGGGKQTCLVWTHQLRRVRPPARQPDAPVEEPDADGSLARTPCLPPYGRGTAPHRLVHRHQQPPRSADRPFGQPPLHLRGGGTPHRLHHAGGL